MIMTIFLLNLFTAGATALQAEELPFYQVLSRSAQGELRIVERLRTFRKTVEKLPDNFQASNLKSLKSGEVVTKAQLLLEISDLEYQALQRRTLIVENTALLGTKYQEKPSELRTRLYQLPQEHLDLNQKLDRLNAKIKEGILVNMATRIAIN